MGGLVRRGAKEVITSFGNAAIRAMQPVFGGSVGGQLAIGGTRTLIDSVAAWGEKQMAAPTALMEWMAKHFENLFDRNAWVGVSTCLQNVRMALEQAGKIFGFGVPLGSPAWAGTAQAAANRLAGVAQHGRPPRGSIGMWNYEAVRARRRVRRQRLLPQQLRRRQVVDRPRGAHQSGMSAGSPRCRWPGAYDSGGWLQPGWNATFNGTGKPEPVLTATSGTRG